VVGRRSLLCTHPTSELGWPADGEHVGDRPLARSPSEHLCEQGCRTLSPARINGEIGKGASELLGQSHRDLFGSVGAVVHGSAGAIPIQAVADVEVLLEVMSKREVEERPSSGR
jgi:hypothetical protein